MEEKIQSIIELLSISKGTLSLKNKKEICIAQIEDSKLTEVTEVSTDYIALLGEKWDYKYVKSLPDAAFAIVYTTKNGVKVRKLPHHNKSVKSGTENSSVDIPHLRNALARLPQIKGVPQKYIDKARVHLENHAKALLPSYKKKK